MIYKRNDRFWIKFSVDGRVLRESVFKATGKNTLTAARQLLRQRLGELEAGTWVAPSRVRLSQLRALIEANYEIENRKAPDRLARGWRHIAAFFAGDPTVRLLTTRKLNEYVTRRRIVEGAAAATVRTELFLLRQALKLAVQQRVMSQRAVPAFPTVHVGRNARSEFYSETEIRAVRAALPKELKNLWTVASWTGWRRNELLGLTWSAVDLEAGLVRLAPSDTKSGHGREFPFGELPELAAAFRDQRAYTSHVEAALGRSVHHVFHRFGKPIRRLDVARQKACREAGAIARDGRPKTLHDLRRTAARRLTQAGVAQFVAQQLVGWETVTMFKRYAITTGPDLRAGVRQLSAYVTRQTSELPDRHPARATLPTPTAN